jgi:hypothetical protein
MLSASCIPFSLRVSSCRRFSSAAIASAISSPCPGRHTSYISDDSRARNHRVASIRYYLPSTREYLAVMDLCSGYRTAAHALAVPSPAPQQLPNLAPESTPGVVPVKRAPLQAGPRRAAPKPHKSTIAQLSHCTGRVNVALQLCVIHLRLRMFHLYRRRFRYYIHTLHVRFVICAQCISYREECV